jgi:hypothetical protein
MTGTLGAWSNPERGHAVYVLLNFPARKLEKGRFSGLYVLGRTMKTEVIMVLRGLIPRIAKT